MRTRPVLFLIVFLAAGLVVPGMASAQAQAAPKIVRTGEAATGYIVVTAPTTEIFASPEDNAPSIGTAVKGDAFPLAGKQEGWYFVATGEATHGWMRSSAAATVYYPEYFAAPKMPDYTPPPPRYPPDYGRGYGYGYPPWGYQRGYGLDFLWPGLMFGGIYRNWNYNSHHRYDNHDHNDWQRYRHPNYGPRR